MFIQLSFNGRPPERKCALFQAIVANLRLFADAPEGGILMVVFETARENFWAAGRVIDPSTGYDGRMTEPDADRCATDGATLG
ncbi:hypothetical protein [Speluncibacter jeojiensis]